MGTNQFLVGSARCADLDAALQRGVPTIEFSKSRFAPIVNALI
jgi:hypothetical protein